LPTSGLSPAEKQQKSQYEGSLKTVQEEEKRQSGEAPCQQNDHGVSVAAAAFENL